MGVCVRYVYLCLYMCNSVRVRTFVSCLRAFVCIVHFCARVVRVCFFRARVTMCKCRVFIF